MEAHNESGGVASTVSTRTQPDEVLSLAIYEPTPAAPRNGLRFRYFIYALVIVVLGGAAGYFVAARGQTIHGARAEIYYEMTTQLPTGFLRQDRSISTQMVALRSRDVLAPVAAANGMTVDELTNEVKVSNVDSSEILRVEVDDPSQARAVRLAGAIAAEYLRRVPPNATAVATRYLNQQLASVTQQQTDLAARIAVLQSSSTPNAPSESVALAQDQAQMQALADERTALQSRLDTVTVQGLQQPVIEQLSPAYALSSPVSPHPIHSAAFGALIGLLIAAIVVWLLARRGTKASRSQRPTGRVTQAWM